MRKRPLTLVFVLALVFPFVRRIRRCASRRESGPSLFVVSQDRIRRWRANSRATTVQVFSSADQLVQVWEEKRSRNAIQRGKVVRKGRSGHLGFFSSLRAKPARFGTDPDPKTIALGAASAKELNCAKCHSEDYRGSNDIPRLAGQVPTYLVLKIDEFKHDARPHPTISAANDKLSDPITEALGAYFGKLEP